MPSETISYVAVQETSYQPLPLPGFNFCWFQIGLAQSHLWIFAVSTHLHNFLYRYIPLPITIRAQSKRKRRLCYSKEEQQYLCLSLPIFIYQLHPPQLRCSPRNTPTPQLQLKDNLIFRITMTRYVLRTRQSKWARGDGGPCLRVSSLESFISLLEVAISAYLAASGHSSQRADLNYHKQEVSSSSYSSSSLSHHSRKQNYPVTW